MTAYFPEIYPDETVYSWFCRYWVHTGYPCYVNVLEELLENRASRVDMEFLGKLNSNAKSFLEEQYGLEYLIKEHTLFPQYARFSQGATAKKAVRALIASNNIYDILHFPAGRGQERNVMYCPACVKEDRQKYGEAYWHREWFLRGIDICSVHGCRLEKSGIKRTLKASPRLYPADDILQKARPQIVTDEKELDFARYVVALFRLPLTFRKQPSVSDYLTSKLEGTDYISARGQKKYIRKMFQDMQDFYVGFSCNMFTKQFQLEKIFTGFNQFHAEICQIAYFLHIEVSDLANMKLPKKSQTERFNEAVAELYQQGLGCHRIARQVGSCPSCALKANRMKEEKNRDHSGRKGILRADWETMDRENCGNVRTTCDNIYNGAYDNGRPHKVTPGTVARYMGFPNKRFDYLPKCMEIIQEYTESQEEYWAREIQWAINRLQEEEQPITIKRICSLTDMRADNYSVGMEVLNSNYE